MATAKRRCAPFVADDRPHRGRQRQRLGGLYDPEQAAGEPAGPPSDIYSLGATLYTLLTNQLPFQARNVFEAIDLVKAGQFAPPREVKPDVPPGLEAICLKAMRLRPADRYATAQDMAADLERWLADEPVAARPDSPFERIARWTRRHRALARSAAVALLVVTVVSVVAAALVNDERQTAESQRQIAVKLAGEKTKLANEKAALAETEKQARNKAVELAAAERQARERSEKQAEQLAADNYAQQISLAHREWLANNVQLAENLLDQTDPKRRGWEWNYLKHLCHAELYQRDHAAGVTCLAGDDNRIVLAAGHNSGGLVSLWFKFKDQYLGGPTRSFFPENEQFKGDNFGFEITHIVVDPKGKWVAAVGRNPTARFNDRRAGVKVWDLGAAGKELWSWTGDAESLAVSPDGKLLAIGGTEKIYVVNTENYQAAFELPVEKALVFSLAFSPDATLLATGDSNGLVKLWDVKTHEMTRKFQTQYYVECLAFSPKGDKIASAGIDRRIDIWDLKAKPHPDEEVRPWLTLRGHRKSVRAIAFAPNKPILASASNDQSVKLWSLETGEDYLTLRGHTESVTGVLFTADGKRVVSGSLDTDVKFWNPYEEQDVLGRPGIDLAASPDGKYLATTGTSHSPFEKGVQEGWLWDAATGELVRTFKAGGDGTQVNCAAFSADGRRLALGLDRGKIEIFEVGSGKHLQTVTVTEGYVADRLSTVRQPLAGLLHPCQRAGQEPGRRGSLGRRAGKKAADARHRGLSVGQHDLQPRRQAARLGRRGATRNALRRRDGPRDSQARRAERLVQRRRQIVAHNRRQ